eukprot:jgi/Chlat1/2115/Chrsp17S02839
MSRHTRLYRPGRCGLWTLPPPARRYRLGAALQVNSTGMAVAQFAASAQAHGISPAVEGNNGASSTSCFIKHSDQPPGLGELLHLLEATHRCMHLGGGEGSAQLCCKGHVTVGGSIRMESWTRTGWTPAMKLESLLVEIYSHLVEGSARLDIASSRKYSLAEV